MTDIVLADEFWEGVEAGTEALLDRWLVGEGDHATAGQIVAGAVLVKTSVEIAAPADGIIERILVPKDATFGRGSPLAVLRED